MIIDITLNDYKEIIASSKIIGKTYENKATILKFKLTDEAATKNFYLDIEKPNGTKFTTSELSIINNVVEYEVPNTILDIEGFLKIEVILTDDDNYQMKYPALTFKVEKAINATDILPSENQTILGQIQNVLDLIDTTGDGTKYLSDDGTYKEVAAAADCGVTKEESSDDNLIYLRDLATGVYVLNGSFRSYNGSTQRLNFVNTIACINRTNSRSYVQIFYPPANRIQYIDITDEEYTITQVMLNSILTRLSDLEEKVG